VQDSHRSLRRLSHGFRAAELAVLDYPRRTSRSTPTRFAAAEREDFLENLADLEIYPALLAPFGVRGLVIVARTARAAYFDWIFSAASAAPCSTRAARGLPIRPTTPILALRDVEYARGYADGVHTHLSEPILITPAAVAPTVKDQPPGRTESGRHRMCAVAARLSLRTAPRVGFSPCPPHPFPAISALLFPSACPQYL